MSRCRLSRASRDDLREILDYIASDSPYAARVVNERIEQTFRMLAQNPHAGRARPELAPEMRSFPTGSNVIFYRFSQNEVFIVRILHAARDSDREFGDK